MRDAGRRRRRRAAGLAGVTPRRIRRPPPPDALTPKAICRLARVRRILALTRAEPDTSWAEVALRGGSFDQAHLANEVRRITGLTPSALRSVFSKMPPAGRG